MYIDTDLESGSDRGETVDRNARFVGTVRKCEVEKAASGI
jgi:hypothetical protein